MNEMVYKSEVEHILPKHIEENVSEWDLPKKIRVLTLKDIYLVARYDDKYIIDYVFLVNGGHEVIISSEMLEKNGPLESIEELENGDWDDFDIISFKKWDGISNVILSLINNSSYSVKFIEEYKYVLKEAKKDMVKIVIYIVVMVVTLGYVSFSVLTREKIERNFQTKENVFSISPSLSDSSFTVGTGIISDINYYMFMIKDTVFDGFVKEKIPVSRTLIKEIDNSNVTPFVIRNMVQNCEVYYFNQADTSFSSEPYSVSDKLPDSIKYEYILYIPQGTVIENTK